MWEGQVDCIYINPPYNPGAAEWMEKIAPGRGQTHYMIVHVRASAAPCGGRPPLIRC
jgi:hypothetical protein